MSLDKSEYAFSRHAQESVSFDEIYTLKKALENMGYKEVAVTTVNEEWVISVSGKEEKVRKQRAKKEPVS